MSHADITLAVGRYDEVAARLAADETLSSAARAEQLAEAQAVLLAELRGPVNAAQKVADAAARDALTLRVAADAALADRLASRDLLPSGEAPRVADSERE